MSKPIDPAIADLLGKHKWDASLAGAATNLALAMSKDKGGLSQIEVREACWQAGWAYPVLFSEAWTTGAGSRPPLALRQFIEAVPKDVSLGLVRARNPRSDTWVALVSRPAVSLGSLPRRLPLGGRLVLPTVADHQYTVASPLGRIFQGPLALGWSTIADVDGEWLIEVSNAKGPVATFPVYVGLPPPEEPLLKPGAPSQSPDAARSAAYQVLANVRSDYGFAPYVRDPMLEQAAPWSSGQQATAKELAPRLGFPDDGFWRWECTSASVESCLADIVWNPRARPGLFEPNAFAGVNARLLDGHVQLLVLVGRDSTAQEQPR